MVQKSIKGTKTNGLKKQLLVILIRLELSICYFFIKYPDKPWSGSGTTFFNNGCTSFNKEQLLFQILETRENYDKKNIKKSLIPIKKWDDINFLFLYPNLMKKYQQFGVFILLYWRLQPGCDDSQGINYADQWSDFKSNIPARQEYVLNRWMVCIHDTLMEDVLPKRSRGISMLLKSNNCGYSFLYAAALSLHPNFLVDPTTLLDDFLAQGETESFDNWKRHVDFY